MPVNNFAYNGTLTGSDLTTLLVGENFGSKVNLAIVRNVSLAWDVVTGTASTSAGRNADGCWELTTTRYRIVWTARVTEKATKTTRPVPIVHAVGELISDAGKVITGIGGTLLTWAGISAFTPAAPTAPVSGAAAGIVAGVGVAVTTAGELIKWLTDATVEGWTTTYTDKGVEDFAHTAYRRIECEPGANYPAVDVPTPAPGLELVKSEAVSEIGKAVAESGNLHPPQ